MTTPRRIALLILAALLALGIAAAAASAATYQVTSCHNAPDTSTNNAWIYSETASGRFDHGNGCAGPQGTATSGLYVQETLNQQTLVPSGTNAYWTFTAPSGTKITSLTYDRQLHAYNDQSWLAELEADGSILESCRVPSTGGDTCNVAGPDEPPATFSGLSATSLRFGAQCAPTDSFPVCASGASLHSVQAIIYGSTVTINDPTSPNASSLSGALVGGGWLAGSQAAAFSAMDATGISKLELVRDGSVVAASDTRTCDYTKPAPCSSPGVSTSASWSTVNTATWPDGSHSVFARATDAAGNVTSTSSFTVLTDNTPPAAPAPTADNTWSSASDATWSVPIPPETGRAPINRVDVEICNAGNCTTSSPTLPASAPLTVTRTVAEGTTTLRARLQDAAGNLGDWSSTVPVRRDRTAPPVVTTSSNSGWTNSTTLALSWLLPAADSGSPYTTVELELCVPAGSCQVQSFPASAGAATATIPGEGDGTIRSRLVDAAGNASAWSATSPLRADRTAPPSPQLGTPQPQGDGSYVIPVTLTDTGPGPLAMLNETACSNTCLTPPVQHSLTGVTTPALSTGTWTIGVSATDAAGNTGGTSTVTITVAPAATPTPTPTSTPTPTPAATASPTPTPSPVASVTATPTESPTPAPTATPTPRPRSRTKLALGHIAATASTVTVSGRLPAAATGKIRITLTAGDRRRSRAVRVRRGRFHVSLRRPGHRKRIALRISYSGDSRYRAASLHRVLRVRVVGR